MYGGFHTYVTEMVVVCTFQDEWVNLLGVATLSYRYVFPLIIGEGGANLCVKMCFPKSRKGEQTASQKFRVCK